MSFLSELAGSSVSVDSVFSVYKSETLGNLQRSKPRFGILLTKERCARWIDTAVLQSQSRLFIATHISKAISVYQSTSIDYMFV